MVTQAVDGRNLVPLTEAAERVGMNKKTLSRYVRSGEVYGKPAAEKRTGWRGRPPLLVDMDDVLRLLEGTPALEGGRRRPAVEAARGDSPDE